MRRKAGAIILVLALVMVSAPLPSEAQQPVRVPRVGILLLDVMQIPAHAYEAFRQGLGDLGYIEGQNIVIERRHAEGRNERLPELAAELVQIKVDVIVTQGTAASLAAKQATTTIPVVFIAVGDPVGSGVVASLARPGGNITGLTNIPWELDGKRLELLKDAMPKVRRVAVLWDPDFSPHVEWLKALKISAQALRLELQPVGFRGPADFAGAFAAMRRGGAGALLIMGHPFTIAHAARLAELAARNRLPAISPFREFAQADGFMAYGASLSGMYRRAATHVDKILKGAKPADLPVEQAMRFELVINLKTAKALGLTIPQSVLIRADQVIQ